MSNRLHSSTCRILLVMLFCIISPTNLTSAETIPTHFEVEPTSLNLAAAPETVPLELTLTAGAWLPRIGGDMTLGTGTRAISLETDFDLDQLEVTPNVEFGIRKNNEWDILIGIFDYAVSEAGILPAGRPLAAFGGVTIAPGDTYVASVDITSFNVEVSLAIWHPHDPANHDHADGDGHTDFRFSPTAGFRYVDVDVDVVEPGVAQASANGTWAIPYGGLVMEMEYHGDIIPLLDRLEFEAGFGIGPALGGGGGTMWQVRASLAWHFSANAAVTFGYRLVELDVDNDTFNFGGGLQGLFIGGTFTF